MKRTLCLILAALLLASSMTACGNTEPKETTAQTNAPATQAPVADPSATDPPATDAPETNDPTPEYPYDTALVTENGVAKAHIVVAEGADTLLTYAAEELVYHIKTVTGAEISVTTAAQSDSLPIIIATPESMPELETIFADDLAWLRTLGEVGDTERYGDDGFAIRTHEGKIYIFGATAKGALNGTYDFIEENLGVLWIRPEEFGGLVYDEMPTVTVVKTDYREKSPFQIRVVNRYGHGSATAPAAMDILYSRNRFNLGSTHAVVVDSVLEAWTRESSVGLAPFISNHNVKWWLASSPTFDGSIDEYWETSVNGIPLDYNSSRQVNYWSELTADTIADGIIYYLDCYHDSMNWNQMGICMEDLGFVSGVYPEMTEPFEYAPGQFVEPSDNKYLSTVYFTFINRIARKVAEKYPDVMINTFAYSFAEPVPLCEIEDNVLVMYCHYNEDLSQKNLDVVEDGTPAAENYANFTDWVEKTRNIINYNYYGCYFTSGWYERPIWYRVQNDMQFYAEHGMSGVTPVMYNDNEHPYDLSIVAGKYTNNDTWAMNILTHWIISKLCWNPYEDVDALIVEFCDKVYGDASEHMQEYYRLLTVAWESGAETFMNESVSAYKYNNYPVDYLDFFIDIEVDGVNILEAIQETLEKAWEAADDKEKEYIKRPRECLSDPEAFMLSE